MPLSGRACVLRLVKHGACTGHRGAGRQPGHTALRRCKRGPGVAMPTNPPHGAREDPPGSRAAAEPPPPTPPPEAGGSVQSPGPCSPASPGRLRVPYQGTLDKLRPFWLRATTPHEAPSGKIRDRDFLSSRALSFQNCGRGDESGATLPRMSSEAWASQWGETPGGPSFSS